jgi:hypothetical protein
MHSEYIQLARDFIDFVNKQVGAYTDACSGFGRNRSLISKQVHIDSRPTRTRMGSDGIPVVMSTSVEDPTQPDVIIHRIVLVKEYLAANAEGGSNEQQHARAALIFLFAYWDEEIRPKMASVLGIPTREIVSDVFGDIRLLRNAILHNSGILTAADYQRLKTTGEIFAPDWAVSLPNETMHRIFFLIKKDMARRILKDTGASQSAPFDIDEINEVAIQNVRP